MAHPEQSQYFRSVKNRFPGKFTNCSVLDIGSLDVNGNNRYLFTNYKYVGVDIGPGKNVDVVSRGHEYKSDTLFDIVISSECFEHDEFWPLNMQNPPPNKCRYQHLLRPIWQLQYLRLLYHFYRC